jgi:hypothetical protein
MKLVEVLNAVLGFLGIFGSAAGVALVVSMTKRIEEYKSKLELHKRMEIKAKRLLGLDNDEEAKN